MRLFGEWLQQRVPAYSVDPQDMARAIVLESDEAIFDRLLADYHGDARQWRRAFNRLQAQVTAELRHEFGDPTPYSLA